MSASYVLPRTACCGCRRAPRVLMASSLVYVLVALCRAPLPALEAQGLGPLDLGSADQSVGSCWHAGSFALHRRRGKLAPNSLACPCARAVLVCLPEPTPRHVQCLFGPILVESIRKLQYYVSREDEEAYFHLWRYIGHLIGVDPEMIPRDYVDCVKLACAIREHQCRLSVACGGR